CLLWETTVAPPEGARPKGAEHDNCAPHENGARHGNHAVRGSRAVRGFRAVRGSRAMRSWPCGARFCLRLSYFRPIATTPAVLATSIAVMTSWYLTPGLARTMMVLVGRPS